MSILQRLAEGLKTYSEAETLDVAEAFAHAFPKNCTLALEGDLGAGKTTFTRGIARAWGIDGPILSPTYNLYFTYQGAKRTLVHLDAYRLQGDQDMENLLIDDFLKPPWCLAVEWPEKAASLLTPETWHLTFECSENNGRVLKLKLPGNL